MVSTQEMLAINIIKTILITSNGDVDSGFFSQEHLLLLLQGSDFQSVAQGLL